jgi:tryptophan 2,3-dioxygenase
MTPLQFSGFRDRLESASGFQSAQFRELEAVLGRRDPGVLERHPPGPARDRIAEAMAARSLYETFLSYVGAGNGDREERLLAVYRADPVRAMVCERMVDLDEGLQEWRYRHVKMVERTLGAKPGTGGSSGADYLRGTLFAPVFPDLWSVRTRF